MNLRLLVYKKLKNYSKIVLISTPSGNSKLYYNWIQKDINI